MTPYWIVRLAIKRLIISIGFGSLLIEHCQLCGRKQALTWHADDDLWLDVCGRLNVVCPECFDRRAAALDISLEWAPSDTERVEP